MFRLLESFPAVERAVVMVQKEVGVRLTASLGTRDYGVLTVLLGIFSKVRPLFNVGPRQFFPPPKVDSMVLRIDFAQEPLEGADFPFLRKLVSKAFQQRRKTLGNSLSGVFGLAPESVRIGCAEAAIDPKRRAETLSVHEFLALARSIHRQTLTGKRL
jgi:16S rRNA (adenine1518-N6/adenine1519-N6)-dimethyltransferase